MAKMFTDIIKIEMLEATVSRIMKQYDDKHDFCL